MAEKPTTPTRNISLTPEQDAFIEEAVKPGDYQNPVRRCAMRCARCSSADARRPLKLEVLRQQIDAGVEALDRGEFTEIDETGLDAYLDGLTDRPENNRAEEWCVIALAACGGGPCAHSRDQPECLPKIFQRRARWRRSRYRAASGWSRIGRPTFAARQAVRQMRRRTKPLRGNWWQEEGLRE